MKILVALLAEGVDRNSTTSRRCGKPGLSPSSRRAWIEMRMTLPLWAVSKVALLAEGVDRNSLPQLTAYSALHPGIANLSPIGLIVRGAVKTTG